MTTYQEMRAVIAGLLGRPAPKRIDYVQVPTGPRGWVQFETHITSRGGQVILGVDRIGGWSPPDSYRPWLEENVWPYVQRRAAAARRRPANGYPLPGIGTFAQAAVLASDAAECARLWWPHEIAWQRELRAAAVSCAGATVTSPECRDGKHRNCDLDALDPVTDAITGCQCECHQHRHHDQETRRCAHE